MVKRAAVRSKCTRMLCAKKSGESPLILYLRGEKKPRMPFGGAPLADGEIATIAKWIDELPQESPAIVLKKAEAGVPVKDLCRRVGVSEGTFATGR